MSPSTFHPSFKQITETSQLQSPQRLRPGAVSLEGRANGGQFSGP